MLIVLWLIDSFTWGLLVALVILFCYLVIVVSFIDCFVGVVGLVVGVCAFGCTCCGNVFVV